MSKQKQQQQLWQDDKKEEAATNVGTLIDLNIHVASTKLRAMEIQRGCQQLQILRTCIAILSRYTHTHTHTDASIK